MIIKKDTFDEMKARIEKAEQFEEDVKKLLLKVCRCQDRANPSPVVEYLFSDFETDTRYNITQTLIRAFRGLDKWGRKRK